MISDRSSTADAHPAISALLSDYGYARVDTPILQPAALFLTRAGDQIADHLVTIDRGGRQIALRPEFTSSAVAHYLEAGSSAVARWQFSGPVFEENDSGPVQRHSIGAELLGMPGAYADAEAAALAWHAVAQQVRGHQLVLGQVALTRALVERFGLDARSQRLLMNYLSHDSGGGFSQQAALAWLDKMASIPAQPAEAAESRVVQALLDTTGADSLVMGGRTRDEIFQRLLRKQQRAAQRETLQAALRFLEQWSTLDLPFEQAQAALSSHVPSDDPAAQALLSDYIGLGRLLLAFGVPAQALRFQPALSRNWDYYSGVVFEVRSASGARLAGGGRYDDFALLLGANKPVPAVGFGLYMDAIQAEAQAHGQADALSSFSLVPAPADDSSAIAWGQALRLHGLSVSVAPRGDAPGDIVLDDRGGAHWRGTRYDLQDAPRLAQDILTKGPGR